LEANPGIVCQTLSRKNPSQKRASKVAQGEGPEFKPQYHKKKKVKKKILPLQSPLQIFSITAKIKILLTLDFFKHTFTGQCEFILCHGNAKETAPNKTFFLCGIYTQWNSMQP
jgi:hypothetical protein